MISQISITNDNLGLLEITLLVNCNLIAPNCGYAENNEKSFIHGRVKTKAKTSIIDFWPYQQIRGDISVSGMTVYTFIIRFGVHIQPFFYLICSTTI